jgi:uncharacterized protein YndB with AHSA1/START domain
MKWIMILSPLAVGLLAAVGFVFIVGLLMPRHHRASRAALFAAAPESIWSVLTDFPNQPSWRPGIRSVDLVSVQDGVRTIREVDSHKQTIDYTVDVFEPPRRMVTRITSKNLPFGGSWTYELIPEGGGTRLRITEDGEIYPPPFRYVARCMGYTATMEKYLKALGHKLGSDVRPEP